MDEKISLLELFSSFEIPLENTKHLRGGALDADCTTSNSPTTIPCVTVPGGGPCTPSGDCETDCPPPKPIVV